MTRLIAGTLDIPSRQRDGVLAAHLASPYFVQMPGVPGQFETDSVAIPKFHTELEELVYDPEGKPRADLFTA